MDDWILLPRAENIVYLLKGGFPSTECALSGIILWVIKLPHPKLPSQHKKRWKVQTRAMPDHCMQHKISVLSHLKQIDGTRNTNILFLSFLFYILKFFLNLLHSCLLWDNFFVFKLKRSRSFVMESLVNLFMWLSLCAIYEGKEFGNRDLWRCIVTKQYVGLISRHF